MKRTSRLTAFPNIPNLGEGRVRGRRRGGLNFAVSPRHKCKQVVVKCQCGCANQHMLVQGLIPSADYNIAAERTFAIELTKGTACVLSPSEQPEETRNTHGSRANGTNVPVGSILVRFCWPSRRGVRTHRACGNGMGEEEEKQTVAPEPISKKTRERRTRISAPTSGSMGSGRISVQLAHVTVCFLALR